MRSMVRCSFEYVVGLEASLYFPCQLSRFAKCTEESAVATTHLPVLFLVLKAEIEGRVPYHGMSFPQCFCRKRHVRLIRQDLVGQPGRVFLPFRCTVARRGGGLSRSGARASPSTCE